MIAVYEIIKHSQHKVLLEIEERWGKLNLQHLRDPEDDPSFRYHDRLMRQKPEKGRL